MAETPITKIRFLGWMAMGSITLLFIIGITLVTFDGWILFQEEPVPEDAIQQHEGSLDLLSVAIDPEDIPDWVPLYPDAMGTEVKTFLYNVEANAVIERPRIEAAAMDRGTVRFTTHHDAERVASYYQERSGHDEYRVTIYPQRLSSAETQAVEVTNYESGKTLIVDTKPDGESTVVSVRWYLDGQGAF